MNPKKSPLIYNLLTSSAVKEKKIEKRKSESLHYTYTLVKQYLFIQYLFIQYLFILYL